jgi:hypothetical protein
VKLNNSDPLLWVSLRLLDQPDLLKTDQHLANESNMPINLYFTVYGETVDQWFTVVS